MTESPHPHHEDEPHFAEMSSAERYKVNDGEVVDTTFGVPDRHKDSIANALETTLEQMGIDPDSVVFSGFIDNDEAKKAVDEVEDLQTQLRTLADEANAHHRRGDFDTNPALRDQYRKRIEDVKQEIKNPLPRYYFADRAALRTEDDITNNPIDYAGVTEGSSIGVYDKQKLKEVDHEGLGLSASDMWIIRGLPEQIESAKLAVFHPRFQDEAGQPLD